MSYENKIKQNKKKWVCESRNFRLFYPWTLQQNKHIHTHTAKKNRTNRTPKILIWWWWWKIWPGKNWIEIFHHQHYITLTKSFQCKHSHNRLARKKWLFFSNINFSKKKILENKLPSIYKWIEKNEPKKSLKKIETTTPTNKTWTGFYTNNEKIKFRDFSLVLMISIFFFTRKKFLKKNWINFSSLKSIFLIACCNKIYEFFYTNFYLFCYQNE